ncbi:hypothetical protein FGB62_64g151 [Gracilaria domingensis]|nr:hypothetical protein FGB62_250g010 [Gracilaria domingensis]KAI0562219.1 hypothetical protein FGB62_64g151 [Gracilaria domingensis]
MDGSVIAVSKTLASSSEIVEILVTAASAARQASSSAKIFEEDGETGLSAMRMLRCEKLLKSLRETLPLVNASIKRAQNLVDPDSHSTPTKAAEWNKLGDAWWHERGCTIHDTLHTVAERERAVSRLLCRETGDWELDDSYDEIVSKIADFVEDQRKEWGRLVSYTKD